jgi:hypothetical protein
MSLKGVIDKNITFAFNQLKDLAIDAVFSKKSNVSFDFGSREVVPDVVTTQVTTKIVIITTKRAKTSQKESSTSIRRNEIMVKSNDVGDLYSYDTVTYEGNTWSIGEVLKNDGYISIAEVFRST